VQGNGAGGEDGREIQFQGCKHAKVAVQNTKEFKLPPPCTTMAQESLKQEAYPLAASSQSGDRARAELVSFREGAEKMTGAATTSTALCQIISMTIE
jgi:hypothetical protein